MVYGKVVLMLDSLTICRLLNTAFNVVIAKTAQLSQTFRFKFKGLHTGGQPTTVLSTYRLILTQAL
jgi:hypothetical protein